MHRAIRVFSALRRHRELDNLRGINDAKPDFLNAGAGQIKNVRDEIHHFEEAILKGRIGENEPIAIRADGIVVPAPDEPGQTIKTIDRLVIGTHYVLAADVAKWLAEMSMYAQKIADSPVLEAPLG